MRRLAVAVVLSSVLLVPAPAPAVQALDIQALTATKLKVSGFSYFRTEAPNVELGSYGQKKTPLGKSSYLSVSSRIRGDTLAKYAKIRAVTRINVNWSKYSASSVSGGISLKYFKDVGGTGSFSHQKAKSASLDLVKLTIDETPMENTINHASGALNFLDDEGGDGRVVAQVWIVMEATLAETFVNATTFEVTGSTSTLPFDVTAKVGTGSAGSQTITISKGTTFAYSLWKVKKWGKKHESVEDLEDDQKGFE
jgi:hypothetical protein